MRLDQVWLRYGTRASWVLRAVEVEIGPGQSAVVLGRNGVGKSTLLQVAVGVLRPSRGSVRDRPRTVGWVPERFPADQPYTVEQYLGGMARIRGLSGAATTRTVTRWIERLGLSAYRDVRLPALSKGTAQKVGLAQALLRPPGLLVLDEPWEGLDAATRELVPELIGEVLDDGGAVLVSDHRGETVRLPYAAHWTVADATVTVTPPAAGDQRVAGPGLRAGNGSAAPTGSLAARPGATGTSVVEIAVPAERALETVAALRRAGHQVLRVRPAEPPPTGHADPPERPAASTALAAPAGSAVPAVPAVPAASAVPAVPGVSSAPAVPAVPAVPGASAVPAVPAVPAVRGSGGGGDERADGVDGAGERQRSGGASTGEAS